MYGHVPYPVEHALRRRRLRACTHNLAESRLPVLDVPIAYERGTPNIWRYGSLNALRDEETCVGRGLRRGVWTWEPDICRTNTSSHGRCELVGGRVAGLTPQKHAKSSSWAQIRRDTGRRRVRTHERRSGAGLAGLVVCCADEDGEDGLMMSWLDHLRWGPR